LSPVEDGNVVSANVPYTGASNVGPNSSKDDTTKDVRDTYSVSRS